MLQLVVQSMAMICPLIWAQPPLSSTQKTMPATHMPREVWLILLSCYVIRPCLMILLMLPFDVEPLMRQVFIVSTILPVSSMMAVLSRHYGADEEFASEAVGMSTIALVFAAPVWFTLVGFL